MTDKQKRSIEEKYIKQIEEGKTITCFLCGKEMKITDQFEWTDGRWMHTKCCNEQTRNRRN